MWCPTVAARVLGTQNVRVVVVVADVDAFAGLDRLTASTAHRKAGGDQSSHLEAGSLVPRRPVLAIPQPRAGFRRHRLILVRRFFSRQRASHPLRAD